MVKVSQQLAPPQTSRRRINLQRYIKLDLHSFRKETKEAESKKKIWKHVIKEELFFSMALRPWFVSSSIKVSLSLIRPSTAPSLTLALHHTDLFLVGEALAGFFPAAGRAPLILSLHPVHLAALLGLAATLPADGERNKAWGWAAMWEIRKGKGH